MPLLRSAALLRSETTPPGLVAVAVVALAEGISQALPVPSDTARVLWNAVQRSPTAPWCSLATTAIGEIANAQLVVDVLASTLDPNTGVELAAAALDVLSGAAAASLVGDRDLLAIAERARGRLVRPAANVVRAVCEARRVPPDVVGAIGEGWSRRRDVGARITALDLLDVLPTGAAQKLVEAAVSNEHSGVRATATFRISDVFGRDAGLALVDRCLTVETHPQVVADLLTAKGELLTMTPV